MPYSDATIKLVPYCGRNFFAIIMSQIQTSDKFDTTDKPVRYSAITDNLMPYSDTQMN